jgi:hypothetical protein
MPQEIFERSLHLGNLQVPNVEILFVLVEKPREDPVLAGFGISERYTDDKFRGWVEREQEEWSEAPFQLLREKKHFGQDCGEDCY